MSAAVQHLLRQMRRDPRLAYLIGPCSQSYELLTEEAATAAGRPVSEFREEFEATLKFEAWPKGGTCNAHDDLVDALYRALPFIEEAETDPHYKTGAAKQVVEQIRAALAKAGAA